MIMNKHVSTPFNVAMHIQELLTTRSVLALVNGEPWDMHKPLTEDCEVKFLHFHNDDPYIVNSVFWRTGSFILGHVLETAFKDKFDIELCRFPAPSIKSGSFVYDADIKIPNWEPTQVELDCLSRIGTRLSYEEINFERLEVDASVALEMFKHNRFKSQQIPDIASESSSGNTVVLYRMGDHIDITRGPLIANTRLLSRLTVTALHNVNNPQYGALTRVQGLAMPKQLQIHYWTYDFLCERAAKLNKYGIVPKYNNRKTDTQLEDIRLEVQV